MSAARLHQILFGHDPNEDQSRLYGSDHRGYLGDPQGDVRDEERVIAVFVLAISLSHDPDGFKQVFMIVPAKIEQWIWGVLRRAAKRMFAGMTPTSEGAKALRAGIEHVMLGSKFPQVEEEPPKWVSFGMPKDAEMPAWMPPRLLV